MTRTIRQCLFGLTASTVLAVLSILAPSLYTFLASDRFLSIQGDLVVDTGLCLTAIASRYLLAMTSGLALVYLTVLVARWPNTFRARLVACTTMTVLSVILLQIAVAEIGSNLLQLDRIGYWADGVITPFEYSLLAKFSTIGCLVLYAIHGRGIYQAWQYQRQPN